MITASKNFEGTTPMATAVDRRPADRVLIVIHDLPEQMTLHREQS